MTPDTVQVHPVRELYELCQKENYQLDKTLSRVDGVTTCRIEIKANGVVLQEYEYKGYVDRKAATRLACKEILKSLQLVETQPK